MKKTNRDKDEAENEAAASFGGILSGLGGLVEKLSELAKTGEESSSHWQLSEPKRNERDLWLHRASRLGR